MRWMGCWAVVVAVQGAGIGGEVPRYGLEPGQELRYETKRRMDAPSVEREYKVKKSDGTESVEKLKSEARSEMTEISTTFTVLAKNGDGSVRVLARQQTKTVMNGKEQGEPQMTLAYFDLSPDGTIAPNPSIAYYFDPSDYFPPMPRDEKELENGWTRSTPDGWETTAIKVVGDDGGGLKFERTVRNPWSDAYQVTDSETLVFDAQRGVVSSIQKNSTQLYGFEHSATTESTLKAVETIEVPALRKLAAESGRYFELVQKSEELQEQMSASPEAPRLFGEAQTLVDSGKAGFEDPLFVKAAEGLARSLEGMKSYHLESAAERSKLLGQPAPAWELKDLDGKTHTLEEYKGKVVLLDFWYRGCGWCVRSMPQLRQIAEATESRPVVLLGLNTDEDVNDAKFVADLMKLNYTTLTRAGEVPEKYGVRGFPTMIVVGQDGKVADIHVGYSTELKERVLKSVEKALSEGNAGE